VSFRINVIIDGKKVNYLLMELQNKNEADRLLFAFDLAMSLPPHVLVGLALLYFRLRVFLGPCGAVRGLLKLLKVSFDSGLIGCNWFSNSSLTVSHNSLFLSTGGIGTEPAANHDNHIFLHCIPTSPTMTSSLSTISMTSI
jgi:hypothetical protein